MSLLDFVDGKDVLAMRAVAMFLIVCFCVLLAGISESKAAPSYIGATGGLLIPNPVTLKPDRYEFAVTGEFFTERMESGSTENTADISMKVNFGVYDNLEMGFEKTVRSSSDIRHPQMTMQAKYRLPVESFNLSLGTVIALGERDYHSLYVVGGWKALYGGFGANFGGRRLEELTTNTIRDFGTAKFGGYNLRRSTRTGSDTFIGTPEDFFVLFGVDFQLSDNFSLLMDYNGDRFAAGVRLNLKDFNVDAAYISQAEIDSILDRKSENIAVSAGVRF